MALEITDATFEEVVLKSAQPVVVDFWAEWCGPCKMLGPTIEELAGDFDGKVVVGKVDVDVNQDFASQRKLRSWVALGARLSQYRFNLLSAA